MKIQNSITITVRAIALSGAFSLLGGLTANAAFSNLPAGTAETPGVAVPTAAAGEVIGTVVASRAVNFADTGLPSPVNTGVLNSLVVNRGGGLLDFYYQVVNTSNPGQPLDLDEIFRIKSIAGFQGVAGVQVSQTNSLAGLIGAPALPVGVEGASTADRDVGSIGSIGFDFSAPPAFFPDPSNVGGGEASSFLIIRTNATTFGDVTAQISGGGGTSLASTFAAIPEPGSMVFGLGILGVCFLRNRKSQPSRAA
jgi:hypothetical protein